MALSLSYPSPFGGDAFTYFIVGEVRENRYYGNATIGVYGFLNADARHAMANFISVPITIDSGDWIKDATIEQIYTLLKATPEFASATDV
jgi:hypothetical protein